MRETRTGTPSLIHRASTHYARRPGGPGTLDEIVSWDYMGPAEFEFGTLPRSIRALRLYDQDEGLVLKKIKHLSNAVWFFGPEPRFANATLLVEEEFSDEQHRRKEYVGMKQSYAGDERAPELWFAVNDRLQKEATTTPHVSSMPYVLFKTKKLAKAFCDALRAKKV